MLETQSYVLERFLQGIMGKSKQKVTDSDKKDDTAGDSTGKFA